MFYKEIRTKQGLSYISIYSLSILYNSKFILMATSLGTNAVVVTRVHCNLIWLCIPRTQIAASDSGSSLFATHLDDGL